MKTLIASLISRLVS